MLGTTARQRFIRIGQSYFVRDATDASARARKRSCWGQRPVNGLSVLASHILSETRPTRRPGLGNVVGGDNGPSMVYPYWPVIFCPGRYEMWAVRERAGGLVEKFRFFYKFLFF